MNAQKWKQIREIFEDLLELDREARKLRLADIALTEPEIADQVRDLLEADARSSGEATSLVSVAGELINDLLVSDHREENARWQGRLLGPWKLEREIGCGGMGAVWLANRADGAY